MAQWHTPPALVLVFGSHLAASVAVRMNQNAALASSRCPAYLLIWADYKKRAFFFVCVVLCGVLGCLGVHLRPCPRARAPRQRTPVFPLGGNLVHTETTGATPKKYRRSPAALRRRCVRCIRTSRRAGCLKNENRKQRKPPFLSPQKRRQKSNLPCAVH